VASDWPPIFTHAENASSDLFTAIVTGHDPKVEDMSYIGPFWVSTVVAGLLGGEVWVAETDDTEKKVIGCAVWFGPGHTMYDSCVSSSNLYRVPCLKRDHQRGPAKICAWATHGWILR
jgi:hypothetical protein